MDPSKTVSEVNNQFVDLPVPSIECPDSIKVYETEGTPIVSSLSTSMQDVRDFEDDSIIHFATEDTPIVAVSDPPSVGCKPVDIVNTKMNENSNLICDDLHCCDEEDELIESFITNAILNTTKKRNKSKKKSIVNNTTSEDHITKEDEEILQKCIEFALPNKKCSAKIESFLNLNKIDTENCDDNELLEKAINCGIKSSQTK